MFTKNPKAHGFTIVELLIVIVVIAILATISIVAYGGIQDRAKTSSGKSLASQVVKKAQIYNVTEGSYPHQVANFATGPKEANLDDASLVHDQSMANYNNKATFGNGKQVVYRVVNNYLGACIWHWDYQTNASVIEKVGEVPGTSCTNP